MISIFILNAAEIKLEMEGQVQSIALWKTAHLSKYG